MKMQLQRKYLRKYILKQCHSNSSQLPLHEWLLLSEHKSITGHKWKTRSLYWINRLESLGSQRKAFGPWRTVEEEPSQWEAKILGGFLSTKSSCGCPTRTTGSLKENFLMPHPSRHTPSAGMINTLQQSLLSNWKLKVQLLKEEIASYKWENT